MVRGGQREDGQGIRGIGWRCREESFRLCTLRYWGHREAGGRIVDWQVYKWIYNIERNWMINLKMHEQDEEKVRRLMARIICIENKLQCLPAAMTAASLHTRQLHQLQQLSLQLCRQLQIMNKEI